MKYSLIMFNALVKATLIIDTCHQCLQVHLMIFQRQISKSIAPLANANTSTLYRRIHVLKLKIENSLRVSIMLLDNANLPVDVCC